MENHIRSTTRLIEFTKHENAMKKTILYRLFGFGSIPKKWLPTLQEEGVLVSDEGVSGWLIMKNVRGPGKRYIQRAEGFSGCLVITKKRVLGFTYWKRQINIAIDNPKIYRLIFNCKNNETLSICFESSVFREGWEGEIEFRFKTKKARQFCDSLKSIGAQQVTADEC